jgi:hypothetical protein
MGKFNNGQPDETSMQLNGTLTGVVDGAATVSIVDASTAGVKLYENGVDVTPADFVMTEEFLYEATKITLPVGFGIALTALKMGNRITRQGWNGKGMYLYLVPEGRYQPTTESGHRIAARHQDYLVPYQAYVAMKTVDETVVPWLCSQTDLLADDWIILP